MRLQHHQSNINELFQTTLVKLCRENLAFSGDLELDGLFCISNGDISNQIVVKIHKVIQPSSSDPAKSRSILKINQAKAESPDIPLIVEVRRGKSGDSIVYRTEHSTDAAKESNLAFRKDGKTTDGSLLVSTPNNSSGLPAASKKSILPVVAMNLSKNSPKLQEIPDLYRVCDIKEEPMQDSSNQEDDSASECVSTQDSCGTHGEMKCKLCQVNFDHLNDLEAHMRENHGRFVCKQCLATFSLSCNLRRHMKLHTGIRPHVCPSCNASFSRSTDLKIHMKKHFSGKEALTCSFCSLMFGNTFLLAQHKAKVHGSTEELFACEYCEKKFCSESSLKLHRKTHVNSSAGGSNADVLDLTPSANDDEQDGCGINGDDDDDDEMSFEDGNGSNGSACHRRNNFKDGKIKDSDLDEIQNLPLDFKINRVPNQESDHRSIKLEKQLSNSYIETVKEFAPLFSLGDCDDPVRSSNMSTNLSDNMSEALSLVQRLRTGKNKRKGMPVKLIASGNEIDEMKDGAMLCDDVGNDETSNRTASNGNNFNRNESTDDEEDSQDRSFLSYKSPQALIFDDKRVDKSGLKIEKQEGVVFSPSSDVLSLNNNDSENRVFTCRHGGCSTSWYGFGAYESHYISAHCRYPCELCDQSFTSRNNRRRHANGHGNVKKHTCDQCDKLFARPDIVKEHRITHTNSYQVGSCCKCQFTCPKKTMLLSHLKRCLTADDIDHDIVKQ